MYRRSNLPFFPTEFSNKISDFKRLFVLVVALLALSLSFATPGQAAAITEDFVLLADTHLGQPYKPSYEEVEDALYWASEFDNLKAVCVAGDLTDRGDPVSYSEWEYLCDSILDGAAHIQALGDHDTGKNGAYLKAFPKLTVSNGYKCFKQINGGSATSFTQFKTANVITIGGVRAKGYRVLTTPMLKKLNERLLKTARQGKMAIVICHYPYNDSALNMRSKLIGILRSYPNVIYVSGHKHRYPTNRLYQEVKPSGDEQPYARKGVYSKTAYSIKSIGVNACSAYRAGNGVSYGNSLTISTSGKITLKKWNLNKKRVEKKRKFKQAKSSVKIKLTPTSKSYPKNAVFKYRVVFSNGKTYGGVKSGSTISLKAGRSKIFKGIPAGVLVTVTQMEAPKGWSNTKNSYIEVGKSARTLKLKVSYSSSNSRLRAAAY